MRDPSLHITKSNLIQVLNDLNYTARTTGAILAEDIFNASQEYQIRDRYLKILNLKAKPKKKVVKSMAAEVQLEPKLVEIFNKNLVALRQNTTKNPTISVQVIGKTHRDYLLLKEVAKMAYEFAAHYNFDPLEDGIKKYILSGLKLMRKYGLNRFKTYNRQIFESFEDELKVLTDDNRSETLKFHSIWQSIMLDYSTLEYGINMNSDYDKAVHFIYAREQAKELGALYTNWIVAQFEGLTFMNAVPELSQFYGENAKGRYLRYMNQSKDDEEDISSVTEDYK